MTNTKTADKTQAYINGWNSVLNAYTGGPAGNTEQTRADWQRGRDDALEHFGLKSISD